MNTTYRLTILDRDGMYTYGERAETPQLARVAVGKLKRSATDRLCLTRQTQLPGHWTDAAGNAHSRWDSEVIVDIEPSPGDWAIGADYDLTAGDEPAGHMPLYHAYLSACETLDAIERVASQLGNLVGSGLMDGTYKDMVAIKLTLWEGYVASDEPQLPMSVLDAQRG